jgi:CcmD family protein
MCFLLLLALATPLDKLTDEDLAGYRTKTGEEAAHRAGERFLADLEQRDAYVAAALVDAATVRFHDREARRFAKDRRAVILGYSVIWVLTVAFTVWLWRRQVRLNAELAALNTKLGKGT